MDFAIRHQERHDSETAELFALTVEEALHRGLVARTTPRFLCPAVSPESTTGCRLEPGHEGAHCGWTSTSVSWA